MSQSESAQSRKRHARRGSGGPPTRDCHKLLYTSHDYSIRRALRPTVPTNTTTLASSCGQDLLVPSGRSIRLHRDGRGLLVDTHHRTELGGAAPRPLKAHDDHEELANDLRRAEASHIKVMSAKKATVDAADLAKRLDIKAKLATPAAAPADDDDDDDGDEPAAPDQPKDGAPAPAPAAPRDDDDADAGPPGSCLLYTSPSPRDATLSRMPSSA